MQTWVDAGVAKSKLAVGLPLYGRGWLLASPSANGLGAPATAAIPGGVYTQEPGSWAFFEICSNIAQQQAVEVFNTTIQASYAYQSSWWIGYDNVQTITGKVSQHHTKLYSNWLSTWPLNEKKCEKLLQKIFQTLNVTV